MERLTLWHINTDLDRLHSSQEQIDNELNHLSRIIHLLRNRQQKLVEKRDDNLSKYFILKNLKLQQHEEC